MRRALLLVAVLVNPACMPVGDYDCAQLADELERCGLPPANLACLRLTDAERRLVIERLEDASCAVTGERYDDNPDVALCELLDWRCPGPLFSPPAPRRVANPIVLVGGIDDEPALSWNPAIADAMADAVLEEVLIFQPSPWAVPEVRALELDAFLAAQAVRRPGVRFNLVCWAVAGLDCRALVSPGGIHADDPAGLAQTVGRVASVTTVATPHRGTTVATAALELADGDAAALLDALGASGADRPDDTRLEATLRKLMPAALQDFNQQVVDHSDLYYASWAGVSHPFGQPYLPSEAEVAAACTGDDGVLRWARSGDGYDVLAPELLASAPYAGDGPLADGAALVRPSDGMIAVHSAKWGDFRGCVPADHYDLVGQVADRGVDPNSGFEAVTFYQNVAVDLAGRGL